MLNAIVTKFLKEVVEIRDQICSRFNEIELRTNQIIMVQMSVCHKTISENFLASLMMVGSCDLKSCSVFPSYDQI